MNKANQELLLELIHPDLKAALIERGCYRMACDNLKAFYADCNEPDEILKDQIKNYENLFIYIDDCFTFHGTPQGCRYWQAISISIPTSIRPQAMHH